MAMKNTLEISGTTLVVPEIQGMTADDLLAKPELTVYMRGGTVIKIKFSEYGLLEEAMWDIRHACERCKEEER